MGFGERRGGLDRKVRGAAPVDRSGPAAEYDEAIGALAPLARSLSVRAALYGLGTIALGLHMLFGGRWKALLVVAIAVILPALLVARLSTNTFPARFPEAPAEALTDGGPGQTGRLVLAAVVAGVALLDVLLLHGRAQEVLFVVAGLPAMVLWSISAEVTTREEDGYVLAVRAHQLGRLGRGIYRVPRP